MTAILNDSVHVTRLALTLLGVFAAIALTLAAIGIYGVMSYVVRQRTREIGTRIALGAGSGAVVKMVLRHALLMVGIGLILGLAGSFALTRVIKSALYGVTATDPATYVGISALLLLVALVACLIPTRRAVSVHPTIALRYE